MNLFQAHTWHQLNQSHAIIIDPKYSQISNKRIHYISGGEG